MIRHCFAAWDSPSADCLSAFVIPNLNGRTPYFESSNVQSVFLLTFIFTIPIFLLMVVLAAWPYRLCGLRGLLRRFLLWADVFSNNSGDPTKGGVSVAGGIVTIGVILLALFFCVYTILASSAPRNMVLTPAPNAVQSSLDFQVDPEFQLFFEWRFVPDDGLNCTQVCSSLGGSEISALACTPFPWSSSECRATWLSPVLSAPHPPLAYNTATGVRWEMHQLYVGSYVRWQGASGTHTNCHRQYEATAKDDTLLFDSYSVSSRRRGINAEARFRRVYFDVESTLSREGIFSTPCFADGVLFDSLKALPPLSPTQVFSLQTTPEPYPQMVVAYASAFSLAASIFSILGAALGLIRPLTSAWHYSKGCARKHHFLQLLLSLLAVIACLATGFALQFGYALKNNLFGSEVLLVYVFLMSVGCASLLVWVAHAVHFCQARRSSGWSTQSAPLLSP